MRIPGDMVVQHIDSTPPKIVVKDDATGNETTITGYGNLPALIEAGPGKLAGAGVVNAVGDGVTLTAEQFPWFTFALGYFSTEM